MTVTLDTHHRALAVNLDPTSYGTFAEIGAGQEVARWFLQVGAAAGTVAKTISAYDMAFSDAIYGKSGRYVSRERLVAMLDHEYPLLLERLGRERGAKSRFFVFADTVSARNYAGTNECHGWMGLRFQTKPGAKPSQMLLHVNLRDATNLLQQQALGILGVNLVHAAFFELGKRERVLDALFACLSLARIEIDDVDLSGPAFERASEGELGVEIVRQGLATAVLMTRSGELVPPTEYLRKHPIVIERHPVTGPGSGSTHMLNAAVRQLGDEDPGLERPPIALSEVYALPRNGKRAPTTAAILGRVRALARPHAPVLVTRHDRAFQLMQYLRRYTKEPLVLAFGAATLVESLRGTSDREQTGRAFESFGKFLGENARMFVEPQSAKEFRNALRRAGLDPTRVRAPESGLVRVGDIGLEAPVDQMLGYLLGAGWVVPLERRRTKVASPARKPRAAARSTGKSTKS